MFIPSFLAVRVAQPFLVFFVLSYYVSLRSEFRVVMSITISVVAPSCCRRAHVLFRMFGSCLPLVVCRRAHVLFRMFGS